MPLDLGVGVSVGVGVGVGAVGVRVGVRVGVGLGGAGGGVGLGGERAGVGVDVEVVTGGVSTCCWQPTTVVKESTTDRITRERITNFFICDLPFSNQKGRQPPPNQKAVLVPSLMTLSPDNQCRYTIPKCAVCVGASL